MTIIEQILPQFMISFFEFLAIPVIDNGFCIIMVGWSLIHFLAGVGIFYLVRKEKFALLIVFWVLVLFEGLEFILSYCWEFLFGIAFILKEVWQDTFVDILLGMISATILYFILRRDSFRNK